MSFTCFATVVLDRALKMPLDYGVPDEMVDVIKPGMRVLATLRGKPSKGTVLSVQSKAAFNQVQPLLEIIKGKEALTEDLFSLAEWMEKYYCTPLSKCLSTMLPASVKKDLREKEQSFIKSLLSMSKLSQYCAEVREKNPKQAAVLDVLLKHEKGILLSQLLSESGVTRSPIETLIKKGILKEDTQILDRSLLEEEEFFQTKAKTLNEEQAKALAGIVETLEQNTFQTHLIHGVTGSGKTEVYLQAIDKALSLEKGVIMLVPEIALTTQTIERLKSRFQKRIAILHHRLSHGQRFDAWHAIQRGEISIVVGARSAIFSPVKNLGLVIIDEEQEGSYKQTEDMPCYHARDVGIVRGKLNQATVVLGSATPALESFYNASNGKYTLHTLTNRAGNSKPPLSQIINMKLECDKTKGFILLSDPLISKLKDRLEKGEQSILFLNRRGYYTCQVCSACNHTIKCEHCDVSLTYHKNESILSCHLCGFSMKSGSVACPQCKEIETLKYRGPGTEQLERTLHAVFPEIRTLRMDRDTTKHKGSHDRLFKEFKAGKADVLIGTQMIAKGLHFSNVTLVGIVGCDQILNIPDFRSNEYAFQLVTQVAGRSGRELLQGEVLIQTFNDEHLSIQSAAKEDYKTFYENELEERRTFSYPPFSRLVKITFIGKDLTKTTAYAEKFHTLLKASLDPKTHLLGPICPSGYAKIKDKHRLQCIIKTLNIYSLTAILAKLPKKPSMTTLIDIDPTHTFF